MNRKVIVCIEVCLAVACGSAPQSPVENQAQKAGVAHLSVVKHSLVNSDGALLVNGFACAGACKSLQTLGSTVTLSAQGGSFGGFAIDCPGPACVTSGETTLSLEMDSDHTVSALFRPRTNFVFVTSSGYGANLGGLAGADAICNAHAQAAGLGGQNYVAWLSTTTVAAPSRLGSARGWIRTDGQPVVDSVEDLRQNQFFYPIRLDERGRDVAAGTPFGFMPVWAGVSSDYDQPSAVTCNDWTSEATTVAALVGDSAAGAVTWTWNNAHYACGGWQLPLFCFETDFQTPIDAPAAPAASRIAFLSSPFVPVEGGSIADADAHCAAEAAAARLPGSFKALLADNGTSPASRFDATGAPWFRLDGVPIVHHARDLFVQGGPLLVAPIDLAADGVTRAASMSSAWTGFAGKVDDYSVPGTASTTCNGWSTRSNAAIATASFDNFTVKSFLDLPDWPTPDCDEALHLYCLQE